MGFFSFKCAKTDLPIPAFPAAKLPRSWSEIVMVLPDNSLIEGVYDGYGNIDGTNIYSEVANIMFGERDEKLIFGKNKTISKMDEYVATVKKFMWDDAIEASEITDEPNEMNELLIGSSLNDLADNGFQITDTFDLAGQYIKIVRKDAYAGETYDELPASKNDPNQGYFYEDKDIKKLRAGEKKILKERMMGMTKKAKK